MTWIENHSWGAQTTEGFWMQHNLQKLNDSNLAKFQLDSRLIKVIFLQFGNCKGKSTVWAERKLLNGIIGQPNL